MVYVIIFTIVIIFLIYRVANFLYDMIFKDKSNSLSPELKKNILYFKMGQDIGEKENKDNRGK